MGSCPPARFGYLIAMAKRPPKPAGSFVDRWAGKFTVRPAASPDPRREALLRKYGLKLPAK